ncbi:MAG: hypothetical protein ABIN58_07155 [candidate division WOR-3 bacterium]
MEMNEIDPKAVEEGKGLAWLSYLGILFLVPMLMYRQNPYVMFHVRQGIVLLGLWIVGFVIGILQIILHIIVGMIDIPYAGCCVDAGLGVVQIAVYIFALVLSIIGIVKSLGGELWKMPLLGGIAEKIKL